MSSQRRQRSGDRANRGAARLGDELFPRTSDSWASTDPLTRYRIVMEPNVASGGFVVFRVEQSGDGSGASAQG